MYKIHPGTILELRQHIRGTIEEIPQNVQWQVMHFLPIKTEYMENQEDMSQTLFFKHEPCHLELHEVIYLAARLKHTFDQKPNVQTIYKKPAKCLCLILYNMGKKMCITNLEIFQLSCEIHNLAWKNYRKSENPFC